MYTDKRKSDDFTEEIKRQHGPKVRVLHFSSRIFTSTGLCRFCHLMTKHFTRTPSHFVAVCLCVRASVFV